MAAKTSSEAVKQIHYLASAPKAPRITEATTRRAEQARAGVTKTTSLRFSNTRSLPPSSASTPPGSPSGKGSKTSAGTLNPLPSSNSDRSRPAGS